MSNDEGLSDEVTAWIRDEADKHHGGDFGRAAAAILTAAWLREQEPVNSCVSAHVIPHL